MDIICDAVSDVSPVSPEPSVGAEAVEVVVEEPIPVPIPVSGREES
jgi:hypothetical protein